MCSWIESMLTIRPYLATPSPAMRAGRGGAQPAGQWPPSQHSMLGLYVGCARPISPGHCGHLTTAKPAQWPRRREMAVSWCAAPRRPETVAWHPPGGIAAVAARRAGGQGGANSSSVEGPSTQGRQLTASSWRCGIPDAVADRLRGLARPGQCGGRWMVAGLASRQVTNRCNPCSAWLLLPSVWMMRVPFNDAAIPSLGTAGPALVATEVPAFVRAWAGSLQAGEMERSPAVVMPRPMQGSGGFAHLPSLGFLWWIVCAGSRAEGSGGTLRLARAAGSHAGAACSPGAMAGLLGRIHRFSRGPR